MFSFNEEVIELLSVLEAENTKIKEFLVQTFLGLPTSQELEEETQKYFAANSSISAAVLTNPGSSIISEILYERRPTISPIDRYFIQSKAGRSVQARLIAVKEKLHYLIEEYLTKERKVVIGNLGSGPGRDVIEVFADYYRNAIDIKALNIDVDERALMRGKRMAEIKKVDHLIEFTHVNFLQRYARYNQQAFDILLLIGVICPVDAAGCISYLQLIKKLLKPGGCLIASNVSKKMLAEDTFTYHIMSRIRNWQMVFKDERELEAIFREAGYIWKGYFTDAYGFHLMGIGTIP